MKWSIVLTIAAFSALSQTVQAQSPLTPNTLSLDSTEVSPPAGIDAVEWIAGHWRFATDGGSAEEVWMPPSAGSMQGMFKMTVDSEVSFYELLAIAELDESLVLRIKHFSKDLQGWEEKDEVTQLPLVKLDGTTAWFDGLTFQLRGDTMNVYVAVSRPPEQATEARFPYRRWDPFARTSRATPPMRHKTDSK